MRCFDDVLVMGAFSVGEHGRGFHGQPTKLICIRDGDFAPSRVVLIQGRKFNPQDTRLDFRQGGCSSRRILWLRFSRLSVHAQRSNGLRQGIVICQHDAAVAIASQVLDRPQAHGRNDSKPGGPFTAIHRSLGLG